MRYLLFLMFLFAAAPLQAACDGPSAFDALPSETQQQLHLKAAQAPFHSGLLWKIQRNNVISYVVGTMHLPDPRHQHTLQRVKPLIAASSQVFLELTKEDEDTLQREMIRDPGRVWITEGPSLIDRLGEEHWAKLVTRLDAHGMPPFLAAKMQPWMLGLTLSVSPCALRDLKAGKVGLDRQVEQEAAQTQRPLHSLDDPIALLNTLSSDPLAKQVDDMKWSLSLDLMEVGADQSVAAMYFDQETRLPWEYAIHRALSLAPETPERVRQTLSELEQALITGRNQNWLDRLVPELSKTPSFVAVGALHLPGDAGILALLSARGFTVTPMDLVAD